jgi:hypothetical protein
VSTAMQNLSVGHDTEVSAVPESTAVGADQMPDANAAPDPEVVPRTAPTMMAAASNAFALCRMERTLWTIAVPPAQ